MVGAENRNRKSKLVFTKCQEHSCEFRISGFEFRIGPMLDLFYILVGALFFVGCWAFTKACDRL